MVMLITFQGCKKLEESKESLKLEELQLAAETTPFQKQRVLKFSPSVTVTTGPEVVKTSYEIPKGIDKMNSILREDQSRKKTKGTITSTSAVTFTATPAGGGSYYNCYAELDEPGSTAWWLINTYTWVMTPLGTTSGNSISFYVNTPALYGSYRIWGENTSNYIGGYTGYQYMGLPYSGVTISSGVLSFSSSSDYDALLTRLKNAYETHQTILDQWDTLTDDNADAAAVSAGFNQYLPFEEFEAHFGIYSLRAKIQAEVDYWFTQPHDNMDDFPEENYFPYTYEKMAVLNYEGQIYFSGDEVVRSLPIYAGWTNPSSPGSGSCMFQCKKKDKMTYGSNRLLKQKVLVDAEDGRTIFVGQSKTYKKVLGLWSPALQRQRTRVYGNQYNSSCVFQTTFNSGYTNSGDKKRYSEEPHYKVMVANQASKSTELHTDVIISSLSSSPYTLTYSH